MRAEAAFWAPWRRSVWFAAKLAERHGAGRGRLSAAGRVFLRPATSTAWWTLVNLWARTDIALARGERLSRPTRRRRDHDTATRVLARAALVAPATVPVASAGAHAAKQAARLIVRATRIERTDSRRAPSVGSSSPGDRGRVNLPGASRVARVLRNAVPVPLPAADRPDPGWGTPSTILQRAQPTAFPPAELERLTEHVMQSMDRRLRAHRERHGRG